VIADSFSLLVHLLSGVKDRTAAEIASVAYLHILQRAEVARWGAPRSSDPAVVEQAIVKEIAKGNGTRSVCSPIRARRRPLLAGA